MGILRNKIEDNKKYKLGLKLAKKEVETGQSQAWRALARKGMPKTRRSRFDTRIYDRNYFEPNYFLMRGYYDGLRKYRARQKKSIRLGLTLKPFALEKDRTHENTEIFQM